MDLAIRCATNLVSSMSIDDGRPDWWLEAQVSVHLRHAHIVSLLWTR